MDSYDVVVIGAGPAGENAAGRIADGGLRVAIVERELVGGECSYWGCIPSKTLLRPGDVLAAARRVPGADTAVTGQVDTHAAFAQRDVMTSSWDDTGQLPWLEERHVELIRGTARLDGPRTVVVETEDGDRRLEARKAVVLATGTTAVMPPIDGLADVGAWDNRSITTAKEVPRRLIVLGGGAIGAEMAQAFRRLGCDEVTVVESADRLLGREEPFAGEEVAKAFEAEGIRVITGVALTSIRREGGDGPLKASLANDEVLTADEILVAVGRRPATGRLALDTVGLAPDKAVAVDDRLLANGVDGEWLYAVGDVNGRTLLTHMGKYQARIAADVILGKPARDLASDRSVPRVTFTDPQVAAVGLTEAQAKERGISVKVLTFGTGDVAGASVRGKGLGGTSQLVVDEERHVIVGATFTGQDVQELLHSATIAVVAEVPLERLWHAVPSFPTVSEVWLRLLEAYGL